MLNGVRYFPLPYIYVGDNVEDFMLGGMSGTVSDYPSPFYLAHKDELDKTKKTFQRRSEADQKQVLKRAREASKEGDMAKRRKILGSQGLRNSTKAPPLMGFAYTDGLRLLQPDRLHMDGKGNLQYALESVCSQLTAKQRKHVNKLLGRSRVPGLHPQGLDAHDSWLTSEQAVVLSKAAIPHMAIYLPEEAQAIAAYCRMMVLRDLSSHTDADIVKLEKAILEAQRLFKLHIRTSQGVKYPKFLAMRAFPDNIRWLGSADLTDTGPYERTHKDAKVAAPFTNNDPGSSFCRSQRRQTECMQLWT